MARQSVRQCFPWLLASDADAVVSVDGLEKKILAVSEMLCDAASKHGIMDFACHDYDLVQKTQARFTKKRTLLATKLLQFKGLKASVDFRCMEGQWKPGELALPTDRPNQTECLHAEAIAR